MKLNDEEKVGVLAIGGFGCLTLFTMAAGVGFWGGVLYLGYLLIQKL